jgi:hypothetical protein
MISPFRDKSHRDLQQFSRLMRYTIEESKLVLLLTPDSETPEFCCNTKSGLTTPFLDGGKAESSSRSVLD